LTVTKGRWRWNAGEEGTPMLRVVTDGPRREEPPRSVLDELVSEGARRMLAAALEAEVVVSISPDGSTVILHIVSDAPWTGSDDQLTSLQQKIHNYVGFAADGQLVATYPEANG
jgi:hypothetical protein